LQQEQWFRAKSQEPNSSAPALLSQAYRKDETSVLAFGL